MSKKRQGLQSATISFTVNAFYIDVEKIVLPTPLYPEIFGPTLQSGTQRTSVHRWTCTSIGTTRVTSAGAIIQAWIA